MTILKTLSTRYTVHMIDYTYKETETLSDALSQLYTIVSIPEKSRRMSLGSQADG